MASPPVVVSSAVAPSFIHRTAYRTSEAHTGLRGTRRCNSLAFLCQAPFDDYLIDVQNAFGLEDNSPFYQAWYFYIVLAGLLFAVPLRRYRRRVQSMEVHIGALLEERSHIARECHDSLMAGFTAIAWQLDATTQMLREESLEATSVAQSCAMARSMVAQTQAEARRILCELRQADSRPHMLSQALTQVLASHPMRQAIATTLEVEGEEQLLDAGRIHDLVCIGQEAVTNAIRHAAPERIAVRLQYENDALSMMVRDDGQGFRISERGIKDEGHFGLCGMEERARKLGGSLHLRSSAGKGTEVLIRIPLRATGNEARQRRSRRWGGR